MKSIHAEEYQHTATSCVCCGSEQLSRSPAILMPFLAHRIYGWEPVQIDESWGLRTIPQGIAYSLCNSLLCEQCGLLFLDIRFSDSEMMRLYENYRDNEYTLLREKYEPGYTERNEALLEGMSYIGDVESFLQPYLPKTIRVLDWGGDTGVNTPFKESASNTIHIYDISGVETFGLFPKVSKQTAAKNDYDLIVCSNVLEHVPLPRKVLREIKAIMRPTTILYVEVPLENLAKEYLDGVKLLEKKRHWHEHINFFNQGALEALMASVGLSLLSIVSHDIQIESKSYTVFMLACMQSEA
jgi:SAM-dependent methyltransferase